MSDFLSSLKSGLLICDGAMGTELYARGLAAGECPELWNVTHPDAVADIHRAYFTAGSRVALTNTFGGSRFKLEKSGLEDRLEELNRSGVAAARRGVGQGGYVLGDVGPTGELPAPLGTHEIAEFEAVFAEQIRALLAGGIDGIILETFTDLDEIQAAVRAAQSVTRLPVLASMQFRRDANGVGLHTMMGVDVPKMACTLAEMGVAALGTNCASPAEITDILTLVRRHTDLPVFAEPNAGVPRLVGDRTIYDLDPEAFVLALEPIISLRPGLLGGCCGTTPEHIRALNSRITKI